MRRARSVRRGSVFADVQAGKAVEPDACVACLDQRADVSLRHPFLQGFVPSLYLTPLVPDECRGLLARGRFTSEETETVLARTGCHPFLVQLIASRLFESRDLGATLDHVAYDEMVSNFFSVDFQTLDTSERTLLEETARQPGASLRELAQAAGIREDAAEPLLYGLRMMGYLSLEGGKFSLGNWFFERWLRRVEATREARPV